jgi:hypothetical protein
MASSHGAFGQGDETTGSGDRNLDFAIAQTLGRLSNTMGVLPGFAFFHGPNSRNAYASSSQRLGRQDGSVVFGKLLLDEFLSSDIRELGIGAICAHEFAHIHQFKTGVTQRLVGRNGRVKRQELHADYLAGWFAGHRRAERPDFPAVGFATALDRAGDYAFSSQDHHGTPHERGAAVVAGYDSGYRRRESFAEASNRGEAYVLSVSG